MADNNPTQAVAQAQPYEIFTMNDGTKFKLPPNLTDEQAMNRIAQAYPDYAERAGIRYDLERDYDFTTGLPDLGTRWDMALTMGNTQEAAKVLNEKVGKGNWGLYKGQPYVTPNGLRQLGIEDKTNRNRMLNGRGLDLYDFVDYAPDIAAGTAATVAALVSAPAGGVGGAAAGGAMRALLSRGLIASSVRGGLGDAAARVGIQGVQEISGYNEDSLGDVLAHAGTSGMISTIGGIVLGAPISVVAKIAQRSTNAAMSYGANKLGVNPQLRPADIFVYADNLKKAGLNADLAEMTTITYALKQGSYPELLTKIVSESEGAGITASKEAYSKQVDDLISRVKVVGEKIQKLGISPDDAPDILKSKIAAARKIKEEAFGAQQAAESSAKVSKMYSMLTDWESSAAGKIAASSQNVQKFFNYSDETFSRWWDKFMEVMADENHYNHPTLVALRGTEIGDEYTTLMLNNLLKDENGLRTLNINELENILPSSIKGLYRGRGIETTVENDFKQVRDIPKIPKDVTPEELAALKAKTPPRLTGKDWMEASRQLKKQAYGEANLDMRAKRLEVAGRIDRIVENDMAGGEEARQILNKVNKEYAKTKNLFFGDGKHKEGFINYLDKAKSAKTTEDFVKRMLTGDSAYNFASFVDALEKAAPNTPAGLAAAAKEGLLTSDELIGSLGLVQVREWASRLKASSSSRELIENAKIVRKQIKELENSLRSAYIGNAAKGKEISNKVFSQENITKFKTTLDDIIKGDAKAAASIYDGIPSFKESEKIAAALSAAANTLSKQSLNDSVALLRKFNSFDPESKKMFNDIFTGEIWSKIASISQIPDPMKKLNAYSEFSTSWKEAIASGNGNALKELLGDGFGFTNDWMNVLGAKTDFPRGVGSISANTAVPNLLHQLARASFTGAVKPLVWMFTLKNLAPGSRAWNIAFNYVETSLRTGKAPNENVLRKMLNPEIEKAIGKAQASVNAIMRGRAGLVGSAIASYIQESDLSLPSEDEAPRVPVTKRFVPDDRMLTDPAGLKREQEDAAAGQQQAAQQFGVALSNLLKANTTAKAASPYAGEGTAGLQQGMKIGRGA